MKYNQYSTIIVGESDPSWDQVHNMWLHLHRVMSETFKMLVQT